MVAACVDTLINYVVYQESQHEYGHLLFSANFSLGHLVWWFAYLFVGYSATYVSISVYFLILMMIIMMLVAEMTGLSKIKAARVNNV